MRLKIYKIRFGRFLFILALFSECRAVHLFNGSCGFQKYQNKFNQKINLEKKSGSNN